MRPAGGGARERPAPSEKPRDGQRLVIPALEAYRFSLVTPMPRLASVLLSLAVVAVAPASGEDANPGRKPAPNGRPVPNVDVWIPVDPGSHENVYWFDGRTHHGAPGT